MSVVCVPYRFVTAGAIVCAVSLAGCAKNEKEKVLDIDTPGVSVEVERNKSDGEVNVDVKGK